MELSLLGCLNILLRREFQLLAGDGDGGLVDSLLRIGRGRSGGFAGFLSGEDVVVVGVVGGQGQGAGDKADLDGAARAGVTPEAVMEEAAEKCVNKQDADDKNVKKDCAECWASKGFAGKISEELSFEVCRAFREESLHGTWALGLESRRRGRFGFERLGDDGDVGDAGLFNGIHDGGECAEGDVFVGAEIDDLMGGIGAHLMELASKVVDIDGSVAEENLLAAVDGDDRTLLGDLFDGASFWDGDFDARLQHGRSDHEDHEQHEDNVDQRSDVDIREG